MQRGRKPKKTELKDCARSLLWDEGKNMFRLSLAGRDINDKNRLIELTSDLMDADILEQFAQSILEVVAKERKKQIEKEG